MPRGRPKKSSEENILIEFKNVTENELMFLEIFSDEDEKTEHQLKAGETVFLSDKDLRLLKNDKRILEGKLVPVDSDADVALTKEAENIMTDERIKYFIINNTNPKEVSLKLEHLSNIGTVERILKEAKKEEHGKSYAFVMAVENKLTDMIRKRDEATYGKQIEAEEKKGE